MVGVGGSNAVGFCTSNTESVPPIGDTAMARDAFVRSGPRYVENGIAPLHVLVIVSLHLRYP